MSTRRGLLAFTVASLFAVAIASPGAHAQKDDFPSRPVTLVAPFPAGSVTDAVTRTIATALAGSLGQPVIVENRAGAQGTIGAAHVAGAKPDGHTLLMGSSGMFVARSLYKSLPYDPATAFVPVSGVGSTAMMFVVAANSPYRGLADLVQAAKRGQPPLTMAYGSPSGQVAVTLFASVTGSKPTAVSYRGIPQAMTDVIGGQVDVAVVDIGSGLAQLRGNKVNAIAISAASRYPGAPEVPTLAESFPDAGGALETIIAILAPAGTPAPIVQKLDVAIRQALASPEVAAQFRSLNTSLMPLSSRDLDARIRADNPRWESFMKKAGIEPQ